MKAIAYIPDKVFSLLGAVDYYTNPYFSLILSSFSNMGREIISMNVTVATAWTRLSGIPCK